MTTIEVSSDIVLYSYSDSESYVSSTTHYTPFPSLTAIEKQKILDVCYAQRIVPILEERSSEALSDKVDYHAQPIEEPIEELIDAAQSDDKQNGCCLLL